MQEFVTVIAIDRAEAALKRACEIFESRQKVNVNAIMLVSHEYTKSPAYKGDETEGYFREIRCNFNDSEKLRKTIVEATKGQLIFHCRLEEAIQDYQKVVTLFPENFCQTADALHKSTQKYEMRKAISQLYPEISPKFLELTSAEEFDAATLQKFNFPLILKPNGLHSSFFVKKCHTIKELEKSVSDTFIKLQSVYDREYGTGKPSLLIEEFIEGKMYSVDAYITKEKNYFFLPPVRVVTAAELGLDGYYSYRHIVPTELNESDIQLANQCAAQAMESVGLTYSVAHIELYQTENGWKIIEIGPRIGGYRQDLYYEAYGIEHYYNDLLIHSGLNPEITHVWEKHAAGFNIYADNEGKIVAINGIEEAKHLKSVIKIDLNCRVGDMSLFASNGGQYLVDGILSNESADALEEDMKKVRELIRFTIK